MSETWAKVPGLPYSVSDQGRVRSDRYGRILRPSLRPTGYLQVTLTSDSASTHPFVHRLVLEAFVGPCPDGMECCHNNGIKTDNRLDNLRWDTRLANTRDAIQHGTHPGACTHCPRGHQLIEPNLTPSGTQNGRRRCLACNRARTYVRNHAHRNGETFTDTDVQSIADNYHSQITAKETAA